VSGCGKCAGYVDSNIKLAQFNCPHSVAVADNGDDIFVTDYGKNAVRKINTLEGTVQSILGKMAVTSFVGDTDNKIHTVLCNSVCLLEIRLRAKHNHSRWVGVFACDQTQFALKTTIKAAGNCCCVVWRERSGSHEPKMSTMSLYNTNNSCVLFRKTVNQQPDAFFLRVSPSTGGNSAAWGQYATLYIMSTQCWSAYPRSCAGTSCDCCFWQR